MSTPSRVMATARMALAANLTLLAIGAAGQTGKALPAKPPTPLRSASPAPSCSQVIEDIQHVSVGKTTRYSPKAPVVRLILNEQSPGSGVIRAMEPNQLGSSNQPMAGSATSGASANLAARPGVNSQPSSARPGAGDVAVRLLSPTDVYLTGNSIGSTSIVMIHNSGMCTMLNVVIGMDPSALNIAIGQLLPNEKDIRINVAFDSLVLKGTVSDSEAVVRITDLANAYVRSQNGNGQSNQRVVNMLEVAAPQQVMLEVKVAEISKGLMDKFGIDFSRAYAPNDGSMLQFLSGILGGGAGILGRISGTGPNGVPFSSVDAVVGGTVPIPGASGGNVTVSYDDSGRPTYTTAFGTVPGRGVSNIGLNMQKSDGLVKVLAEPTIMAISGQTGSFLAGGKIFIPMTQDNASGGRSIELVEKEFGVSVKFTPTVLGNGLINLRVRPEVSELNATGITIRGGGVNAVLPSFTSRKAETTVQLMDGQSFAIGGLIKNNTTTNIAAFPFLGELPVVGALFRSTQFQTDRTELVFVITPRLVKPVPAGYRLPTDGYVPPTRSELILGGKLEGQRQDIPAPGDNPTQGGFDKENK